MQERLSSPDYSISDSSPSYSENTDEPSSNSNSWSGTSVQDLYHNNSPWNFHCPPLTASRHHTVLFELPVNLKEPPKPHTSTKACFWNVNHVRMPFSPKNVFPVKENREDVLKPRWDVIQCALLRTIKTSYELEEAIFSYNLRRRKLSALHQFFEHVLDEGEAKHFFAHLLPKIIGLALQLPELIKTPIPLLKQGKPHAVSLSQLQIACLLANAFLCTFPWKKEYVTFPGINFNRLYECKLNEDPEIGEKLKCILHYFRRICEKVPIGVVTFERRHLPRQQFPRWDKIETSIANIKLHISSSGTIENDGIGMLQVDFANCMIGGGVLGFGCVQEEIRFVICPELIVSRLFTEQLAPNESLLMIGAECYSKYSGYADSFHWSGNCKDATPLDEFGRRKTSIIAIDAIFYARPSMQFTPSKIIRELNKAFVGFYEPPSPGMAPLSPIATGNWGCGAFRGNLHLKALVQIMACAAANRSIVYYTFGDKKLQYAIYNIFSYLVSNNVTIVQLWRYLCRFIEAGISSHQLLPYIKQSHIDSINNTATVQPTVKNYFKNLTQNGPNAKQKSPRNSEATINTAIASTSKDNQTIDDCSPTKETIASDDDVIDASQEDCLEFSASKSPPKSMKKNKMVTVSNAKDSTGKCKEERLSRDVSYLFYSSDEDSQDDKCKGFLSELDKLGSKPEISTSTIDISNHELMEVCVHKSDAVTPEKNPKIEEEATQSDQNKNLSRKSLITDYFVMK